MTSVILRNFQISYQISTGYLQVCYQITTKSLWYLQILHIYNISTRYLCASTTLYDSYDLYGNFQSLLMQAEFLRWTRTCHAMAMALTAKSQHGTLHSTCGLSISDSKTWIPKIFPDSLMRDALGKWGGWAKTAWSWIAVIHYPYKVYINFNRWKSSFQTGEFK